MDFYKRYSNKKEVIVKKVWNWLNGNKTAFGTAAAVIYAGLVAQGIVDRVEAVEWLIITLTGVGVGHKVVKTRG